MKAIVAYLDVLGFSVYSEKDLAGAQFLFVIRNSFFNRNSKTVKITRASSYTNPSLAALAEAHLVDSFKHFLPFSDSIFIVSENPDKFARQLSNYLIACQACGALRMTILPAQRWSKLPTLSVGRDISSIGILRF